MKTRFRPRTECSIVKPYQPGNLAYQRVWDALIQAG